MKRLPRPRLLDDPLDWPQWRPPSPRRRARGRDADGAAGCCEALRDRLAQNAAGVPSSPNSTRNPLARRTPPARPPRPWRASWSATCRRSTSCTSPSMPPCPPSPGRTSQLPRLRAHVLPPVDIAEFERAKTLLPQLMREGDVSFAKEVFDRFANPRSRSRGLRRRPTSPTSSNNATGGSYELNRKDLPWPADIAAMTRSGATASSIRSSPTGSPPASPATRTPPRPPNCASTSPATCTTPTPPRTPWRRPRSTPN